MARIETNFLAISQKMKDIGQRLYAATVLDDLKTAMDGIGARMTNSMKRNMRGTQKATHFYMRGGKKHFPSIPKAFPAVDRGDLWKNLIFDSRITGGKNFKFEIGTDQKHGFYLENGTIKMAERPWLFPTVEKFEPEIYQKIEAITGIMLENAFRGTGRMTETYKKQGFNVRFK